MKTGDDERKSASTARKIMLCEVYKTVNYPGGIEKVLCNFANEFIDRGYDITYVCLDTEFGMPYYPLNENVKFVNLCFSGGNKYTSYAYYFTKIQKEIKRLFGGSKMKFMGKKLSDPKREYFEKQYITRLQEYFKKDKPDIIICADSQSLYLAQEASNNEIPTVAMCHTDPSTLINDVPDKEFEAWKKAKKVQVLLDVFKHVFLEKGIKDVESIPNVVPQFAEEELADDDAAEDTILFVGRLEREIKKPDLLVKAFAMIASEFPQWKVKLYGSDDNKKYTDKIRAFARQKGIERQILFCGTTNDIFNVMRASKILVSTSSSEGFHLAVAEAMSLGLPVVGFRNCIALNEIIQDSYSGYLANDIEDMAAKLKMLMIDSAKRKYIGRNAHYSMKKFEANLIWYKWEELIKGVLKSR